MSKVNQYDINFKYYQMESKKDFNVSTVYILVKISELNECEVATGTFFSAKAKLTSGDVPMKMVYTRYGKGIRLKEDCVLVDESG